jgi:hypothetical protein
MEKEENEEKKRIDLLKIKEMDRGAEDEPETAIHVKEIDRILDSILNREGEIGQLYHALYLNSYTPQLSDEGIGIVIEDARTFTDISLANPALAFLSKLSESKQGITEAYFDGLSKTVVFEFLGSSPTQATLDFFTILCESMSQSELFINESNIIAAFSRNGNTNSDEELYYYLMSCVAICKNALKSLSHMKTEDFLPFYEKMDQAFKAASSLSEQTYIALLKAFNEFILTIPDLPQIYEDGGPLDIIRKLYTCENETIDELVTNTLMRAFVTWEGRPGYENRVGYIKKHDIISYITQRIDDACVNSQITMLETMSIIIQAYPDIGREYIIKSVENELAHFAVSCFENGSVKMKNVSCNFLCMLFKGADDDLVHDFLLENEVTSMLLEIIDSFPYEKLITVFTAFIEFIKKIIIKGNDEDPIYGLFKEIDFLNSIAEFCDTVHEDFYENEPEVSIGDAFGVVETDKSKEHKIKKDLHFLATLLLEIFDESRSPEEIDKAMEDYSSKR